MKVLIKVSHPAQYHFFRNITAKLRNKGIQTLYVIREKDVLTKLLDNENEQYVNILPEGRASGSIGMLTGLMKRNIRLYPLVKKEKPDLLIGTDPSIAHIGKLLSVPALTVLEDDVHVIPKLAKMTFPFTSHIIAPEACDCGKWNYKKIPYAGYMKLSYLHPAYFNIPRVEHGKYFLIRTSKLDAHHDNGIKGLNRNVLSKIINMLKPFGDIRISAEGTIAEEFREYELQINPSDMHNVLYNSQMLISDSQSMTMEAAMLGIPSIRVSDFAGRISVLEELEHKYNLTYGIKSGDTDKLFSTIHWLLNLENPRDEFQEKRRIMLNDKIDVAEFFFWLISEYPRSVNIFKSYPEYQYRFRHENIVDSWCPSPVY